MRKTMHILCVVLLAFSVGCVQKAKISMLQPGELKLAGVSKIAMLDFNTISTGKGPGMFAASKETCRLAQQTVADVFYKDPFYALVDLSLERHIKREVPTTRLNSRLDAVMYGRVWWQMTDEYYNYIPSKTNLRSWKKVQYVCGYNDEGKPYYCTVTLPTKTWDVFFEERYRTQKASLMMGLSVYRLDRNGQVEKLTHVFEVASRPAFLVNGKFSERLDLAIGKKIAAKIKALATDEGGGFFDFFTTDEDKDLKADLDAGTGIDLCTLPVALESQAEMCREIGAELQHLIAPHRAELAVPVAGGDKKIKALIAAEAFMGGVKYLARKKLGQGSRDAAEAFYDVECLEAAKKVIARSHRADYEASIQGKKPEAVKPYKPLGEKVLRKKARDYLEDHVDDLYNMALSLEALGDFERALEIYRFAFENYENEDQNYADGIGRCLLALDMADRLTEEEMAKIQAKEKASF